MRIMRQSSKTRAARRNRLLRNATTAMRVHIVIGIWVAILAVIEIWLLYQRPPRRTAAG